MTSRNYTHGPDQRSGMILYVVVALLGILTALAWVVYTATRIDFQVSRNYVLTQRAFEQAESGLHFAKTRIERRLIAGESLEQIASSLYVTAPTGYDFDTITGLTQLADTNQYVFTITGRASEAKATLQAVIRQGSALALGIFGDLNADTMPSVNAYSYDAQKTVGDPVPEDSTGHASIGSNLSLVIQPNVNVDGRFVIGEDEMGMVGSYPAGWGVDELPRIEPDPLGIRSGALAAEFASVKASNDNTNSPYIINNELILKNHGQIVIPAGNYYLTEVEIGNHSAVLADTSGGPVNIFLEGGFYMGPDGDLNTTGKPSDFRIFSNSTEQIQIKPKGDAKVFLYAPDAEMQVYPGGHFYGVAWGEYADLKPGGNIWIDVSMLNKLVSYRIIICSWKEVRA